nr:PREDICTED: uncharacterized protein LOC109044239 [Bemisia tabaci]XP_018917384.1 PREDICTED: uncharacterized protein LOC109044239 [Bemisia tabaci]
MSILLPCKDPSCLVLNIPELITDAFLENIHKANVVYTSRFNKWYLRTHLKIDDSKIFSCRFNQTYLIQNQGCTSEYFLSAVPSNFSSGSAVFVLKGDSGYTIYLGKFRDAQKILLNPLIQRISQGEEPVVVQVVDPADVFGNVNSFNPPKDEVTPEFLSSLIRRELKREPERIIIGAPIFGTQKLLLQLAQELQITLKLDRVRETIFSFLQLNEDFYSAKKNPDHIEVKDLSSFSYNSQQKKVIFSPGSRFENAVYIKIGSLPCDELTDEKLSYGSNIFYFLPNVHTVTQDDLGIFLDKLKPRKILDLPPLLIEAWKISNYNREGNFVPRMRSRHNSRILSKGFLTNYKTNPKILPKDLQEIFSHSRRQRSAAPRCDSESFPNSDKELTVVSVEGDSEKTVELVEQDSKLFWKKPEDLLNQSRLTSSNLTKNEVSEERSKLMQSYLASESERLKGSKSSDPVTKAVIRPDRKAAPKRVFIQVEEQKITVRKYRILNSPPCSRENLSWKQKFDCDRKLSSSPEEVVVDSVSDDVPTHNTHLRLKQLLQKSLRSGTTQTPIPICRVVLHKSSSLPSDNICDTKFESKKSLLTYKKKERNNKRKMGNISSKLELRQAKELKEMRKELKNLLINGTSNLCPVNLESPNSSLSYLNKTSLSSEQRDSSKEKDLRASFKYGQKNQLKAESLGDGNLNTQSEMNCSTTKKKSLQERELQSLIIDGTPNLCPINCAASDSSVDDIKREEFNSRARRKCEPKEGSINHKSNIKEVPRTSSDGSCSISKEKNQHVVTCSKTRNSSQINSQPDNPVYRNINEKLKSNSMRLAGNRSHENRHPKDSKPNGFSSSEPSCELEADFSEINSKEDSRKRFRSCRKIENPNSENVENLSTSIDEGSKSLKVNGALDLGSSDSSRLSLENNGDTFVESLKVRQTCTKRKLAEAFTSPTSMIYSRKLRKYSDSSYEHSEVVSSHETELGHEVGNSNCIPQKWGRKTTDQSQKTHIYPPQGENLKKLISSGLKSLLVRKMEEEFKAGLSRNQGSQQSEKNSIKASAQPETKIPCVSGKRDLFSAPRESRNSNVPEKSSPQNRAKSKETTCKSHTSSFQRELNNLTADGSDKVCPISILCDNDDDLISRKLRISKFQVEQDSNKVSKTCEKGSEVDNKTRATRHRGSLKELENLTIDGTPKLCPVNISCNEDGLISSMLKVNESQAENSAEITRTDLVNGAKVDRKIGIWNEDRTPTKLDPSPSQVIDYRGKNWSKELKKLSIDGTSKMCSGNKIPAEDLFSARKLKEKFDIIFNQPSTTQKSRPRPNLERKTNNSVFLSQKKLVNASNHADGVSSLSYTPIVNTGADFNIPSLKDMRKPSSNSIATSKAGANSETEILQKSDPNYRTNQENRPMESLASSEPSQSTHRKLPTRENKRKNKLNFELKNLAIEGTRNLCPLNLTSSHKVLSQPWKEEQTSYNNFSNGYLKSKVSKNAAFNGAQSLKEKLNNEVTKCILNGTTDSNGLPPMFVSETKENLKELSKISKNQNNEAVLKSKKCERDLSDKSRSIKENEDGNRQIFQEKCTGSTVLAAENPDEVELIQIKRERSTINFWDDLTGIDITKIKPCSRKTVKFTPTPITSRASSVQSFQMSPMKHFLSHEIKEDLINGMRHNLSVKVQKFDNSNYADLDSPKCLPNSPAKSSKVGNTSSMKLLLNTPSKKENKSSPTKSLLRSASLSKSLLESPSNQSLLNRKYEAGTYEKPRLQSSAQKKLLGKELKALQENLLEARLEILSGLRPKRLRQKFDKSNNKELDLQELSLNTPAKNSKVGNTRAMKLLSSTPIKKEKNTSPTNSLLRSTSSSESLLTLPSSQTLFNRKHEADSYKKVSSQSSARRKSLNKELKALQENLLEARLEILSGLRPMRLRQPVKKPKKLYSSSGMKVQKVERSRPFSTVKMLVDCLKESSDHDCNLDLPRVTNFEVSRPSDRFKVAKKDDSRKKNCSLKSCSVLVEDIQEKTKFFRLLGLQLSSTIPKRPVSKKEKITNLSFYQFPKRFKRWKRKPNGVDYYC